MPTVTGTLTDIGLDPLAPFNPVLRFTPSQPAGDGNARIFASRPVEVTPTETGYFSVDLASTDTITPADTHWRLTIHYRKPDGYDNSGGGFTAADHVVAKIRVPAAGGILADLFDIPPRLDDVHVGNNPPSTAGYLYWVNTSASPATLNVWSD